MFWGWLVIHDRWITSADNSLPFLYTIIRWHHRQGRNTHRWQHQATQGNLSLLVAKPLLPCKGYEAVVTSLLSSILYNIRFSSSGEIHARNCHILSIPHSHTFTSILFVTTVVICILTTQNNPALLSFKSIFSHHIQSASISCRTVAYIELTVFMVSVYQRCFHTEVSLVTTVLGLS